MRVEITISKEDITDGVIGCPRECAVAKAFRRATGEMFKVVVSTKFMQFLDSEKKQCWRAELPPVGQKFISDFDTEIQNIEQYEGLHFEVDAYRQIVPEELWPSVFYESPVSKKMKEKLAKGIFLPEPEEVCV